MLKPLAGAASALALFAASPVFAGGPVKPVVEPAIAVAPPVDPWSGLWAGVSVGEAFSTYGIAATADRINNPANFLTLDLPDFGGHGGTFGVQGGYNHRFGARGVWGVEVDADHANTLTETSLTIAYDSDPVEVGAYRFKTESSTQALGRLGFLANDHTLIYGLFGLTSARGTARVTFEGDPIYNSSLTLTGPTVGLGMETMLTDRLSLKIDYQLTAFNRHSYWDHQQVTDNTEITAGLSTNSEALHAALVWHF